MKKIITLLFVFCALLNMNNKALSQANSVGLNGSFVYNSIAAAYTAIGGTISSAQVIELSASYNGSSEVPPIILGAKTGASSTNSVTIRPAAGANGLVLTGSVNNGIIRFNACKYVYLDGRPGGVNSTPTNYLTISNTLSAGTYNSAHAVLFDGAIGCKSIYLNANSVISATGARGVISIGGSVSILSGNSNVIANNIIKGGQRCIQVGGTVLNSNDTVRNNDVSDYAALGIFTNLTSGIYVANNRVHFNSALTTAASVIGIQNQGNSGVVTQNEVDNLTSANATGFTFLLDFGSNNVLTKNNLHDAIPVAAVTQIVGVQFSGYVTTLFSGNQVHDLAGNASTTFVIALTFSNNGTASNIATISNNRIYNLSSAGAANIRAMSCFPKSGSTLNITNNFISITQPNNTATAIFGILIGGSGTGSIKYNSTVTYNSVRIGGVKTGGTLGAVNSYGILRDNDSVASVYTQKYNNVLNERTTGDANTQIQIASWVDNIIGTISVNFNNYNATDTLGGVAGGWVDSLYTNFGLTAYKAYAAPQEANTTFNNVNKLSLTMNFQACPNVSAVTVQLRSATSPYSVVETTSGMAGGATATYFNFANAISGVPYYLVVRSANMIETWSASTVTFSSSNASYNFTSALSQAYGNNQVLSGGIPSVYQGDANQDGFVDGTDVVTYTYADVSASTTSPATDFNCDGFTDLSDLILDYNNAGNFIQVIRPPVLDGQVITNLEVSRNTNRNNSVGVSVNPNSSSAVEIFNNQLER